MWIPSHQKLPTFHPSGYMMISTWEGRERDPLLRFRDLDRENRREKAPLLRRISVRAARLASCEPRPSSRSENIEASDRSPAVLGSPRECDGPSRSRLVPRAPRRRSSVTPDGEQTRPRAWVAPRLSLRSVPGSAFRQLDNVSLYQVRSEEHVLECVARCAARKGRAPDRLVCTRAGRADRRNPRTTKLFRWDCW